MLGLDRGGGHWGHAFTSFALFLVPLCFILCHLSIFQGEHLPSAISFCRGVSVMLPACKQCTETMGQDKTFASKCGSQILCHKNQELTNISWIRLSLGPHPGLWEMKRGQARAPCCPFRRWSLYLPWLHFPSPSTHRLFWMLAAPMTSALWALPPFVPTGTTVTSAQTQR